jgi:hypothetical protein
MTLRTCEEMGESRTTLSSLSEAKELALRETHHDGAKRASLQGQILRFAQRL